MRISVTGPAIRRGDVWWVAFDPSIGGEITKTRPAVVVSNDSANRNLNRFQVVPLTRATKRIYPSEALVRIDGTPSKAAADQISTAARERFGGRIGRVSREEMAAIEAAIRIQLAL
jgi:mRNA interferase MazF